MQRDAAQGNLNYNKHTRVIRRVSFASLRHLDKGSLRTYRYIQTAQETRVERRKEKRVTAILT